MDGRRVGLSTLLLVALLALLPAACGRHDAPAAAPAVASAGN